MTQDLIKEGYDLLSQAREKMITAITDVVEAKGSIEYYDRIEFGNELRVIKYNEDKNLFMFDDCDNELVAVEKLTADDLYDICLQLTH